jgi:ribose/xylose/arabinose/galactoside ABC-type transport system permease subunit
MKSLGYHTTLHLYAAFVISGAMASLAGVPGGTEHGARKASAVRNDAGRLGRKCADAAGR